MRVLALCLAWLAGGCMFDSSGVAAADATSTEPDVSVAEGAVCDLVSDVAAGEASREMATDSTTGDGPVTPDGPWPDVPLPDAPDPDLAKPDLPSIDLPQGPLVIEAESYSSKQTLDSKHNWVVQSNIPQYSGTGFILASPALPDDNCQNNYTSCGARADYKFSIPTASTHLHFRSYADDGNANSFAWGVDGVYKGYINYSTLKSWTYLTASTALSAGAHTLTLWMRENGNRVDLIVVSDSSTPPAIP